MRLPHHPEAVAALRTPTEAEPWRVLVSGCIFGWQVGIDGSTYGMDTTRPAWLREPLVEWVPFCPEDHALGTPRTMPDLHDGDGFAVLDGRARVLDPDRVDLTAGMVEGARAMVALAQEKQIDFALLTDRSGACGSQVISLGCRFEEPVEYRKGVGVAAAALLREGVPVVSHRDFKTLELLHQKLDPEYDPDPDALDHHEHPWVVENLGGGA